LAHNIVSVTEALQSPVKWGLYDNYEGIVDTVQEMLMALATVDPNQLLMYVT
jgi:hypothetical protein